MPADRMENKVLSQVRSLLGKRDGIAAMLGIALVYFSLAKLGFLLAFQAPQVTVVWAPTGVALAAVLLLGRRIWPGIALGAFVANVTSGEPLLTAAFIALGNTLEAVTGAWLMRRFDVFSPQLHRVRHVLSLVVFAAMSSTIISATIGVTSLCLAGLQPWSAYNALRLQWWLGDAFGDLIVAPFLLVWCSQLHLSWSRSRKVEAAIMIAGLVGCSLLAFQFPPLLGKPGQAYLYGQAFIYIVFPFIIWGARRFGQRGTTLVTFVTAIIGIWATTQGLGPFTAGSGSGLIPLQVYMTVIAVTGLLLSASVSEQNQAQSLLAALVESSEDAIISRTLDGTITSWNGGAERLFGYSAREAIGRQIDFVTPPDRQIEERYALTRLREGRHSEHHETVRIAKDERLLDISLTISLIYDRAGQVIGVSNVARDISKRKQTEAQLKATLEEVTIAKRSAEMAQEKAELANRAKGDFLANMSHEIRTPLNSIIGISELLGHTKLGPEQHEFVKTLTTAGDVLLSLINNVLDYSKIESGEFVLAHEPLAVRPLLGEVAQILSGVATEKNIVLNIQCAEDTPTFIIGDAMRLRQILLNLAGNAIKFTSEGTVTIQVEPLADTLRFRVKDSGAGIPSDKLEIIFDKFTQLDAFSTKKYAGTGLGLAICKRLVELMGGNIGVTSALDTGSLFWFDVPLVAVEEDSVPHLAHANLEPRTATPTHFSGTVLLVEDYPPNLEMAKRMLEKLGCTIHIARNGEEALEAMAQHTYDVVFMDCQMPEMDGFETTAAIRERETDRHTIIVAMTANALAGDREACLASGMDDYVGKPIRSGDLARILAKYLKPKSNAA